MSDLAEEREGRDPVWVMPELWERAATRDTLSSTCNYAVKLDNAESGLRKNYHKLFLGSQRLLHPLGGYVFDMVKQEFGFGEFDEWDRQKSWVEELFRRVFPENEQAIGTFSIATARRPAAFRAAQDPSLTITQARGRTHFLRRAERRGRLQIGDIVLPVSGLKLATAPGLANSTLSLAETVIPRNLSARRYSIDRFYEEFWYCSGERDHAALLSEGKLPAIAAAAYDRLAVRLRTTILMNLARVSRSMSHCVVVLEVDPVSGEILSIRWARNPLSAALLCSSPVEHLATCEALKG